ncbi:MAG: PH domain-containing protein [Candidatus Moranbacteria bacterium]|nr:PH domain-containing protein [Candidatus Moranbacteria bacterium]
MKPLDFYFSNQHENEQVLHVFHRHWFDILKQYFPIIILLIIMLGGLILNPYIFSNFTNENSITLFYFTQTLLLLIIWIYSFIIWFDYYLDVWIITNQRVINVEQKGLFSRHVSELRFLQIQDISTNISGFIPTILNYGHVHIQTAAQQSNFMFRSVPNPYAIKATLISLQHKSQRKTFHKKKKFNPEDIKNGQTQK